MQDYVIGSSKLHPYWVQGRTEPLVTRVGPVLETGGEDSKKKTIAVSAERNIGTVDARGGIGALQYPDARFSIANPQCRPAANSRVCWRFCR